MATVTVEDGSTTVIHAPSVPISVADPSAAALAGAVAALLSAQDPAEVEQAAIGRLGFAGPSLA